jgi:hypothetical protein
VELEDASSKTGVAGRSRKENGELRDFSHTGRALRLTYTCDHHHDDKYALRGHISPCEQVNEVEFLGLSGMPPGVYASKDGATATGISDTCGVLNSIIGTGVGHPSPGFNDDSPRDEGKQFLFACYTVT